MDWNGRTFLIVGQLINHLFCYRLKTHEYKIGKERKTSKNPNVSVAAVGNSDKCV